MTSNVGARLITQENKSLGFAEPEKNTDTNLNETVMAELKKVFRPEFLNRVDETIVFSKLSKEEIKEIAALMLKSLESKLSKMGYKAEFSDALLDHIADKGFDPVYGARPIRRAVRSLVEDELSEKLLNGDFKDKKKILCDFEDNNIIFKAE